MENKDQLFLMQIRQLERLLHTKKLSFKDSFFVIFSDYPTSRFVSVLLLVDGINDEIKNLLTKKLFKLWEE